MTLAKWYKQFKFYQNYHDIKVKGVSYQELREAQARTDEWL